MVDEASLAIALTSIFLTVLGLLFNEFKSKAEILERITKLETKMEIFWTALGSYTTKMLRHPITPRADELFDKLDNKTISLAEAEELKSILEELFKKSSNGRKLAVAMKLAQIEATMIDFASLRKMGMKKRF